MSTDQMLELHVTACPICAGFTGSFLGPLDVPVHCNVLWPSASTARRAPRGSLELALCERCGLIRNIRFDPQLPAYAGEYENALHFSAVFREYEEKLARRLVESYELRGKRVVEIGSGDGHFLALLCAHGGNRGLGYDPSGPRRHETVANRGEYTLVPELYEPGRAVGTADLVCARHVLEHLADPLDFVRSVRVAAGEAALYLEVPDADYMLREGAIWDVIYEHCCYFTAEALAALLRAAGYVVTAAGSSFGDQYLGVDARPGSPAPAVASCAQGVIERRALTRRFEDLRRSEIARWEATLAELFDRKRRVVLWGAGSKGVTFACSVAGADRIEAAVDLNPRKHGRHLPLTALPVVPPEALRQCPPDDVLIMNRNYEAEIVTALSGLAPQARTWAV